MLFHSWFFILFAVAVVVLLLANVFNPLVLAPLSIVAAFVGFQIPYFYYVMKYRKRQQDIEDKLLNFVMALTNGLKSGMAFGQSLDAVTKHSTGPIKEEFQQVLREQRLGLDVSEALERLEERVPCEDMQLFVTTVKLTTKTGGSMVEVLSEMVNTMRQRKEFSDKLRSMTAEGRFQAMAISLSPVAGFLLLSLVNRQLMKPLVTTGLGWCAIGVICVLISIGYYIINKIMSIEV